MRTIMQFLLIGIVALVVGFGANALRGKSALSVSKNYFDMGNPLAEAAKLQPERAAPKKSTVDATETSEEPSAGADAAIDPSNEAANEGNTHDAVALESKGSGHLQHDYQTIEYDDIAALVDDPMTQAGLNVFVDARNEQAFGDGHLPGAMLCNPYQVPEYVDRQYDGQSFLDRVLAAEKIVVYCGGGDCADSIFMCRELMTLDVPYNNIYLYEGGWKDWTARGGTTSKGDE